MTVLTATTGVMGVLLIGTTSGPRITDSVNVPQAIGYNLLVLSALLAVRMTSNRLTWPSRSATMSGVVHGGYRGTERGGESMTVAAMAVARTQSILPSLATG